MTSVTGRKHRLFRTSGAGWLCCLVGALLCLLLASCQEVEPEDAVPQELPYISATDIVINEVLASNTESAPAYDGRFYDWVELYNPLPEDRALDGYYLSDDTENPRKCSLAGQTVPARGYLIIYCSGLNITDERGFLHTAFRLSASKGETVCLSDDAGISSLTVPACEPNVSYGLQDGKPVRFESPTPGAPNSGSIPLQGAGVIINEFMTSNTFTLYDCEGDYGDWIELFNTSGQAVDLTGCGLTDDASRPFAYVFPQETLIPQNGFLLVYCDGKNKTDAAGALHANFSLSAADGSLTLFAPDRTVLDSVNIPEMPDNISCGRAQGEEELRFFARATPGKANDVPWTTLAAGLLPDINEGVLISEVLSASSVKKSAYQQDYLEIYNAAPSDVNLKGYTLSQKPGEAFFTFPDVTLPQGQCLVVTCDGVKKTKVGDLHAPIKIKSSGEQFYLADASGRVCDAFASGKCRAGMSTGRLGGDVSRRVVFASPTPGEVNGGKHYDGFAPVPSVSVEGGLVAKGTAVALSAPEDCTVVYTLDGSAPNESSRVYRSPLKIKKNTVLRAAALRKGCLISDCLTQTYFIENPHTLPIVSVSGSPEKLIGETGILQTSNNAMEYPVHVEFFDESCRKAVEFDCGTRHFGAYTLSMDQRGLKLILREIYGQKEVSYNFFSDCEGAPTTFSSLLLRPSGQDQERGKLRDELIAAILRGQNLMDYQEYRPCALYVDGSYWGLYYIREPLNADYLYRHYGLEKGSYDLVKNQSYAQEGSAMEYKALEHYCETYDLTSPEHYAYVCSQVDIDSLINFWVIETYFNNPDSGNVRCYKTKDGKWRWIPYDFDLCMYDLNVMKTRNYINMHLLDPNGHGFGNENNAIIRKLLKNSEFRDRFLTLYCYHIRHTFAPERTVPILEKMTAEIDGEMQRNAKRWGKPDYNTWRRVGPDTLRGYLEQKPDIALRQLQSSFGLTDEELAAYCKD